MHAAPRRFPPKRLNLLNPYDMLYSSRGNAGVAMPPSSQRPTSPTFSMATTQASAVNISGGPEIIITRAHLRTSVLAYEEVGIRFNTSLVYLNFRLSVQLLSSCAAYRDALVTLSTASAHFARAIEVCSRCDHASIGLRRHTDWALIRKASRRG